MNRAARRREEKAAAATLPRVLILPGGTLHVDPGAPPVAVEAAKRAIAKHRREGGPRRSFYLKPGPEGW